MHKTEWSLILFTLMFQCAVGIILFTALFNVLGVFVFSVSNNEIKIISYTVIPLICIGMFLSFLHLGNPKNAFYSLNNLSSSWLSREILFVILFGSFACILFLYPLFFTTSKLLNDVLLIISSSAGICLVFSMAKLYMLKTVPVWNSYNTFFSFFSTSLILATISLQFVFLQAGLKIQLLLLIQIILLTIHLDLIFRLVIGLKQNVIASEKSLAVFYTEYKKLFVIKIFSLIFSIVLLLLVSFMGIKIIILAAAWLLIIISEITGRYLFYTSYKRIGV